MEHFPELDGLKRSSRNAFIWALVCYDVFEMSEMLRHLKDTKSFIARSPWGREGKGGEWGAWEEDAWGSQGRRVWERREEV